MEGDAVILEAQDVFAVVVAGNRLCTSDNLRLNALSMGYSDAESSEVGYEGCLTAGVLP